MKLNRKNITLKLDVSSVTSEGEHTLSCKVDFPDTVGDNVSISDWEDLHVTVTVEKQATKEIPVRGEFIGTEADNCQMCIRDRPHADGLSHADTPGTVCYPVGL